MAHRKYCRDRVARMVAWLMLVCCWGYPAFSENMTSALPENEKDITQNETLDSFFTLYQPYLANISAYNPMFFLVGTNPKNSKFQFSFKYCFFNEKSPLATEHPWLSHMFFAYTQTSYWDLKSQSMPFEDSSYMPEFFYLTTNFRDKNSPFAGLFLQYGLQHESNGQSEDISRSTNYVYVKPIMIFYNAHSQYGIQIAPKLWCYFKNDNETNPDLKDYRGYMDLQVKFGNAELLVVDNHLWAAKEGISFSTDITYPLSRHNQDSLEIYLQLEYSNRLAESLRYYTERSEVFRVGFSIIR